MTAATTTYGAQAYFGTDRDPSWSTPQWLIGALEAIVGPFVLDLASDAQSRRAGVWLGPGSPLAEDAFDVPWDELHGLSGASLLNPPWSRMCLVCEDQVWKRTCSKAKHPSRSKKHWLERAADCGAGPAGLLAPLALIVPHTPGAALFLEHVLGVGSATGRRAAQLLDCGRVRYDQVGPDGSRTSGDAPGFDTAVAIYRGPWHTATGRGVLRGDGVVVPT